MSSQAVPAWSRILPPGPAQPQADPRQRYRITPDAALWCHRQSGTSSRCAGRIGEESLNLTEMSMRMRQRASRGTAATACAKAGSMVSCWDYIASAWAATHSPFRAVAREQVGKVAPRMANGHWGLVAF